MAGSTLYQYLVIICGKWLGPIYQLFFIGYPLIIWLIPFIANLNTIAYGTAVGWTSAAFLVLESNESPLEKGALLLSEIAWVASIFGVGGSVGTLAVGWACEKFGRRPTLLASGIPMAIGWFLIMYAKNAWYLYLSRFLSGFAGASSFVAIPFLVAEVSEDR